MKDNSSKKRYQVFVSSTFADLKDERQAVVQTLMEMDCIPAGMELFPAADEEQWKFIKKVIDDCDYYLLIIAGRYGTTDNDGISYTEKEYDYAVTIGIKVVAFIHNKPEFLPFNLVESSEEAQKKLKQFKEKVSRNRLVKFWENASELPGLVALSMSKTIKMYPMEGWVRASSAREVSKGQFDILFQENYKLREQVKELQELNERLNSRIKEYETLKIKADEFVKTLRDRTFYVSKYPMNGIQYISIFDPLLSVKTNGNSLQNSVNHFLHDYLGDEMNKLSFTGMYNSILGQFSALGLITVERVTHERQREDGHSDYIIEQYVDPTPLLATVYPMLDQCNPMDVFTLHKDKKEILVKRLDKLLEIGIFDVNTIEKLRLKKERKLTEILGEFISHYSWKNEEEKKTFYSQDFINDAGAWADLAEKAHKSIEHICGAD